MHAWVTKTLAKTKILNVTRDQNNNKQKTYLFPLIDCPDLIKYFRIQDRIMTVHSRKGK